MKKTIAVTLLLGGLASCHLALASSQDSTDSTPISSLKQTHKSMTWGDTVTSPKPYNSDGNPGSWTNNCKYYETNTSDICPSQGPVPRDSGGYIGYNYQADCPANTVMVGFRWTKNAWGNRYGLLPKCRKINIVDVIS